MSQHILLLEDDTALARLTCELLQQEGYTVSWCSNAERAHQLLQEQHIDLMLCDVMLPGSSGFDFVGEIRSHFAGPVLFMTAQTQLKHQLEGFALGAQDYLLKPLDPRLLLAKLSVFLSGPAAKAADPQQMSVHNMQLDLKNRTVSINGTALSLSSAEFKLLSALASKFGKVVSRDSLFQQHLGRTYDGFDRTMDTRASRLRRKLQSLDPDWNIVTAWGEGYYLSYQNVVRHEAT